MAIRHVVMFQFVETATATQRQAVRDGLRALKARIPEIKAIQCNHDAGLQPTGNFDFCATVDFESINDYKVYQTHADHQQLIAEAIKPILKARAAVQFELE
ncbi:hypothetical protein KFE25_013297 [Diacronema lutheri]|uniref:Stress-response A/B barrel domain-containing protein n=1 Tax=Diacronema lutheri TaxID=2081491 RepID=A0A8J5XXQ4_DIALT|nr:hypothetical protein KFE25_013297 [Diacronema lutheri]